MPSLGGTALAVGCLSESMEGALREHGVLGKVAKDITIKYGYYLDELQWPPQVPQSPPQAGCSPRLWAFTNERIIAATIATSISTTITVPIRTSNSITCYIYLCEKFRIRGKLKQQDQR